MRTTELHDMYQIVSKPLSKNNHAQVYRNAHTNLETQRVTLVGRNFEWLYAMHARKNPKEVLEIGEENEKNQE